MSEIEAEPELVREALVHLAALEKNGVVIAVGGFGYDDVWVRILASYGDVSEFMLTASGQIRRDVNWGKNMPSFCWEIFAFDAYGLSKPELAKEIATKNADGMDWVRPRIDYLRAAAANGGGVVPLFHRLWGKISHLQQDRLETPCSSSLWKPTD